MSTKNKRTQDSANAHRMKLLGVTRTTCNCPMCHRLVSLNAFSNHIVICKG